MLNNMKKYFFSLGMAAVLVAACIVGACDEDNIEVSPNVTGVTLDPTDVTLALVGDIETLVATVAPDKASQEVTWSTSNPDVATVVDGLVTATGEGKCVVTVKTVDGEKTATCDVTVPEQPPFLTLDNTDLTLDVKATERLIAIVTPDDFPNKTVRWTSDDENVATVSANGTITAQNYGECLITAKMVVSEKTATCKVIVPSRVTNVTIDKSSTIIYGNNTGKLTATLFPATATIRDLKWSSDKPGIVEVSQDGTIIGLSWGTANITVETVDGGFTSTCEVTVLDPAKYQVAVWPDNNDYAKTFDFSNYPGITGLPPNNNITYVHQEVWSEDKAYKQKTYVASPGDWIVEANANTGWGGVRSYPCTGWTMGSATIKSIKSMVASWDVEFPQDATNTAGWACFDLWFNNWAHEVLIIVAFTAPGQYHVKTTASATFEGQIWRFYQTGQMRAWKCGVDDNNMVNRLKGEMDLQPILVWMEDNGYLPQNSTWRKGNFGFEICDTRGVDQIFRVKDFKLHVER